MSLLISPAAGLLKIAPQEGVPSSPGQLISGRVEAVRDDGTVALNLAGRTVEAVAEVRLHPGQEVALEVIGRFAGRLYLKLATDSAAKGGSDQLPGRLDHGNLADAEQAVLFNTLREFQLPLTEKNLTSLLRLARTLEKPAAAGETRNPQSEFLSENLTDPRPASAASRPTLDPGKLRLAGFILALGLGDQPAVWPVLRDYLQQPVNLGAELLRLLLALEQHGLSQVLSASSPAPDLEFFRILLAELLGEEWRSTSSRPERAAPLGAEKAEGLLREWLAIQKPLAHLLRLIQFELGNKVTRAALLPAQREKLAGEVEASLSEALGQQLINTVDKSRPGQPDYYYFSWPLPPLASQYQAELRLYRRPGGCPLDLEDLYLVLCLQTPHLGSNHFDIHLRQREMEIRITVEKTEAVALVEEFWPELSRRLQALGYRADLRECRAGRPEPLRPRPEGRAAEEEIRRIDILV